MRKLHGIVVSDKMMRTRVVAVTRLVVHPRYRKQYKVTKRFKAHDAENTYRAGDKVIIQETRPLSKEKRWIIVGKVNKGPASQSLAPNPYGLIPIV